MDDFCMQCITENRKQPRKKRGVVKILAIVIICAICLYGLQYITTPLITPNMPSVKGSAPQTIGQIQSKISELGASLQSQASSAADSLKPKPTATREELYQYALRVVNDDRAAKGIPPVTLSNTRSAQEHADNMLKLQYFSHWNSDGLKPYVTYTMLGGRGDVRENISYVVAHCFSGNCYANAFDPFKEIKDSEYNMVYQDASSDWGHRDNILDPSHTAVNFGIASDNNRFYFVEHFENNIISWHAVQLVGSELHLSGSLPALYSLSQILVYTDPSPTTLSANDLDGRAPYNLGHYDSGTLAGIMAPKLSPGYYYTECSPGKIEIQSNSEKNCVDYITFENTSNAADEMDMTVNVSKWMGSGIHTIYIQLKKANGDETSSSSLTMEYLK